MIYSAFSVRGLPLLVALRLHGRKEKGLTSFNRPHPVMDNRLRDIVNYGLATGVWRSITYGRSIART